METQNHATRSGVPLVAAALFLLALPLAPTPTTSITAATSSVRAPEFCRLIAEPGNTFTFVAPRRRDRQGADAAGLAPGARFEVTYLGFESHPAAQAAFQAATDMWARLISSPLPIRVRAEFRALGTNVLGSAGALTVWKDFPGAPVPGTYYPDALADRLRGADNNPGQFDIVSVFNSDFSNWYFGTDGATPAGSYDFMTVVMHELGHGLGFYGSAAVVGTSGSLGISGLPTIYDRFTTAETGTQLLQFANPSAALGTQLTSDFDPANPQGRGVYWRGPRGLSGNGGLAPRHFTPAVFSGGSSYSHFDDAVYGPGNANSLMTHALAAAEAIHDPGPIVIGLFADMGWPLNLPSPSAGRDFNRDGQVDLVFENSSGHRYVWFMNGTAVKADTFLTPVPMDATVTVAGINDFTGDGHPDLLMENTSDGRIWLYKMSVVNKVSEQSIRDVLNRPWRVVATGDLNNDGQADIVVENFNTGEFYVWFMASSNGQATYAGPNGAFAGDYIRVGPNATIALGPTTERVVGAADFNSDGRTDLLLWDPASGVLRLWFLSGTTRYAEAQVSPTINPLWRPASVGDFNGDGQPDIIWQHTNTGMLHAWFMNGATLAYDAPLSPNQVNPAWKLIGPR